MTFITRVSSSSERPERHKTVSVYRAVSFTRSVNFPPRALYKHAAGFTADISLVVTGIHNTNGDLGVKTEARDDGGGLRAFCLRVK